MSASLRLKAELWYFGLISLDLACQNSLLTPPLFDFLQFSRWVRLVKMPFCVQCLSDTSIVSGGGIPSPNRLRCNRSNWFMARYNWHQSNGNRAKQP